MATFADLIDGSNPLYPGVIPKLSSNSAVTDIDVQRWLVSAVRNITDTYPFEELCVIGPSLTLTIGQSFYNISSFFGPGYNPQNVTRIDSFVLYTSPGSTDQVPIPLRWRTFTYINPLSRIQGMVIYYTIYGTDQSLTAGKQQVIFAFQPQQAWNVSMSFQEKHPFPADSNNLPSQTILVPDSWLDVIVGAAAMIGAEELRMMDKYQNLKLELYGDPDSRGEPGLIKRLISSRAQMSNVNERQFNFVSGSR